MLRMQLQRQSRGSMCLRVASLQTSRAVGKPPTSPARSLPLAPVLMLQLFLLAVRAVVVQAQLSSCQLKPATAQAWSVPSQVAGLLPLLLRAARVGRCCVLAAASAAQTSSRCSSSTAGATGRRWIATGSSEIAGSLTGRVTGESQSGSGTGHVTGASLNGSGTGHVTGTGIGTATESVSGIAPGTVSGTATGIAPRNVRVSVIGHVTATATAIATAPAAPGVVVAAAAGTTSAAAAAGAAGVAAEAGAGTAIGTAGIVSGVAGSQMRLRETGAAVGIAAGTAARIAAGSTAGTAAKRGSRSVTRRIGPTLSATGRAGWRSGRSRVTAHSGTLMTGGSTGMRTRLLPQQQRVHTPLQQQRLLLHCPAGCQSTRQQVRQQQQQPSRRQWCLQRRVRGAWVCVRHPSRTLCILQMQPLLTVPYSTGAGGMGLCTTARATSGTLPLRFCWRLGL